MDPDIEIGAKCCKPPQRRPTTRNGCSQSVIDLRQQHFWYHQALGSRPIWWMPIQSLSQMPPRVLGKILSQPRCHRKRRDPNDGPRWIWISPHWDDACGTLQISSQLWPSARPKATKGMSFLNLNFLALRFGNMSLLNTHYLQTTYVHEPWHI